MDALDRFPKVSLVGGEDGARDYRDLLSEVSIAESDFLIAESDFLFHECLHQLLLPLACADGRHSRSWMARTFRILPAIG